MCLFEMCFITACTSLLNLGRLSHETMTARITHAGGILWWYACVRACVLMLTTILVMYDTHENGTSYLRMIPLLSDETLACHPMLISIEPLTTT